MRSEKSFQIFVCSLMIMSFLVFPFFDVKRAEAQTTVGTSVSGYIQGLAPVITKLPGCKKVINTGVNGLFSGIKNIFTKKSSTTGTTTTNLSNTLELSGADSIKVTDPATKKIYEKTQEIKKDTADTKTAVENQDKNQNCLNAIGKAVAKILIDKLTLSTIDWIQTGNEGGPLFVQDPGKFFEDIGKAEILGFGLEIQNPDLYPFAKNFMQGVATEYKTKFAQNAQFSLDTLIQKQTPEFSSQTFDLDFTQGGWGAWNAMTQYPQNNPIGFNIMASNELQSRLEGTFQSTAEIAHETLAQGSGFLGQERCADPLGVTKEENDKYLRGDQSARRCNRWEYVTPGKLISEELVSAVQKKDNALLDVETLNDAVAAILDAVLNKFVNQLQDKDVGLAGLAVDTTIENTGPDEFGGNRHRIEQDFPSFQIAASTWLAQNPEFNIRTDLSQALIDEQRIYVDKLKEQNKELESTTDGKVYSIDSTTGKSNAYGLIPTIHQLDYCIPGPHTGWEDDTSNTFEDTKSKILDTTGMDFLQIGKETGRDANVGSVIMMVTGLLGIADTDSIDSWSKWLGTGQAHCGGNVSISECLSRQYYQGVVDNLTNIGVEIVDNNLLQSYAQTINLLDQIYNQYVNAIHNLYIPPVLPNVAKDSENEYEKLSAYQDLKAKNEQRINSMKGITELLKNIKTEIDALNDDLSNGTINQDTYEERLQPWITSFGRVSANMVSGDDIAGADSLLKEIVTEKDYVFKELLTGINGCEKEMEDWEKNPSISPLPKQLSPSVQNRPDYPNDKMILYKYPDTAGSDPLKKSFLYYGVYSSAPGWTHSNEGIEATALCKSYDKYGEDTSRCGDVPNNITGMAGPNVLHIGDLIDWDGDQTRLTKNRFENYVLKIY